MDNKEKMIAQSSRSRLRRQVKIMLAITCLSLLVAFTAVIASICICLYYKNKSNEVTVFEEVTPEEEPVEEVQEAFSGSVYTQEEVDALIAEAIHEAMGNVDSELLSLMQSRLEGGDSTMEVLRDLYPDDVVMLDSGQYYFVPRNDSLTANTYVEENFVEQENGTVAYEENGEVLTKKGIDVSRYQGEIDWEAVKGDGVDYAIIRLGIRGYSEGKLVEDECFKQNMEGAAANEIPVGVYFFTEAVSEEEALEEAQFVIDLLEGYDLEYPVYLDVEDVKKATCRTNHLTAEERTAYVKVFLEAIEQAGYHPAIYGNLKTFMLMLDLTEVEEYDKWLAAYTMPVYYPYEYKMLQYSEKGTVAGITGAVDINISFKDYTIETE